MFTLILVMLDFEVCEVAVIHVLPQNILPVNSWEVILVQVYVINVSKVVLNVWKI